MKKISIVGFGRFGEVLYRLLKDDFTITLFDRREIIKDKEMTDETSIASTLNEVYEGDAIFYAVPIENFEEVISSHKKYFQARHLLIDVLSVKMHPKKVFEKYLRESQTQALLTHPMFGPDSSKWGFESLPMIMDKFLANKSNYNFWRRVFEAKKLKVIEMSAQEHDKLAANSQGLTHFIGRLLDSYGLEATNIDSLGTKKLLEIKDQTCNDTWQLFTNLQHYNPYTKRMRIKLGEKYDDLYNRLLPKQVDPKYITYGIQGGRGSFNEEAMNYFLDKSQTKKYKIKYLYTTEAVLSALHAGVIDRGQFAIHNSVGGIVGESIEAMAKYKFKIVEEFAIRISHTLMIRSDARIGEVDTIMSHPQVFAQCKKTLSEKYPMLKRISGKGKLVDHALVAKKLSEYKLPKSIATIGSKVLATIYNLKTVENNLQDAKENFTSFILVERT
ncbi:MAG: Prephenate dehydrogenase [Candidatus Woesebacteria bacterium GW2011_GWA1_39_8]|uniref:Prephenate dehydrogenase n=1 Tax=Candidatus Woesebacteria bacterium GW2011_GWA1_39_8 TaxID=1618552 RepID=A0A0G0PPY4_9BACT|nr:MAG: Prephenate dehydrogenase [Candidatus Woesebacteria bacterium GW2011_GWA1_39_8]